MISNKSSQENKFVFIVVDYNSRIWNFAFFMFEKNQLKVWIKEHIFNTTEITKWNIRFSYKQNIFNSNGLKLLNKAVIFLIMTVKFFYWLYLKISYLYNDKNKVNFAHRSSAMAKVGYMQKISW